MYNKEYYKKLVSLFEATAQDSGENDINQQQLQIADSGEDVIPKNAMAQQPEVEPELEEQPIDDELDDASYLDSEPVATATSESISEKQRFVKLFDLFDSLLNYSETFYDSLLKINTDMISDEKRERFMKHAENVRKIRDKIDSYLVNIIKDDKYERAIYTYVLLRTEFLTNLQELRKLLELNKENDIN